MTPNDRFVDVGIKLHIRQWPGRGEPFLLVHGLASNCRTWDEVAAQLNRSGHPVVAVDQRGHGLSEKPSNGYDFSDVTADLLRLVDALEWERPLVVGQSWGGNVVLEFGARHPGRARGLGFVDGGFTDLQAQPDATWKRISKQLRPPDTTGTPRTRIEKYLRKAHPDWDDWGVEATLANFETRPDGTVRPWLTLERHMTILRAMWEQRVPDLFGKVRDPVLICVAENGFLSSELRRAQVARAEAGIKRVVTHWFPATDHDIHVHRPEGLIRVFLEALARGIWGEERT